tara:strand:- start:14 stop:388 length:375 start_codon:yes stop_codon:yes gene_type:complete
MATQIVIANKESIFLDNTFFIEWADKGKNWVDAWTPDTIHYVIWNDLPGQNEIQNKDSNGNMTGNTDLNATSDAVGSTTIADLLTWGETRKGQIEAAVVAHQNAIDANTATDSETWRDYDPHYS